MQVPPKPARVFIADKHSLFRKSLRRLLETSNVGVVIGEAVDGAETVRRVTETQPEVLILDLALPTLHGLEIVRRVKSVSNLAFVILTEEISRKDRKEALKLGVHGIVSKRAPVQELFQCIRAVRDGGSWLTPDESAQTNAQETCRSSPEELGITSREMEVIAALTAGRSNREIASKLSVSINTVKNHISSVFDKTGVSTRLELILFAITKNLVNESAIESNTGKGNDGDLNRAALRNSKSNAS